MSSTLSRSRDRKVSPRGTRQGPTRGHGPRWIPSVRNSFGLPSGLSCPGATEFCESCYGTSSEAGFPNVGHAMAANYRALIAWGDRDPVDHMTGLLADMIDDFEAEANRFALSNRERVFRIHWDGDFFSTDYAEAWATVMRAHPRVRFWAYTRSFVPACDVVSVLAGIDNLVLYLSVDEANVEHARAQKIRHPWVLLAGCAVDYRTARELVDEAMVCPENAGRIPLMDAGVGACVSCRLCPDGKRNVLFSTSHREDVTQQTFIPIPIQRFGVSRCRNPECPNTVPAHSGRGRPREFCQEQCRWKVARAREAARKAAARDGELEVLGP